MNTPVEKIRLPLPFSLSKELQNTSKNTFLRYEKGFERNDKIQVG
jgi:hypothetical protein